MEVPVLIRDMKEDQALIDASIEHATAVIICSNDDVSNMEVAIDSRRMNPKARIVMRLFDQQLASKIAGALTVDAAFSSSSLAAPVVAAMALHAKVLSSMRIGSETYVAAEVGVETGSSLAGKRCRALEGEFKVRVLAVLPTGHGAPLHELLDSRPIEPGDTLVVHVAADALSSIAAAGCRSH